MSEASDFDTSSFQEFAQEQAGKLLDLWGRAQWEQPYQIESLRLKALGEGGYYEEGKPGTTTAKAPKDNGLALLLVGAVVVLLIAR